MKKLTLPHFSLSEIRKMVLGVFVAAAIFGGGYLLGLHNFQVLTANKYPELTITRDLPESRKTLDFSMFWKVWDLVDANYFDKSKLIPSKMVYGAIQGLVAAIGDPYTAYFPPDENKVVQEDLKGDLEGIGIQIGFKGTSLAVIAPLPGTPAEKVGIKAGDLIIGIKDDAKKIDHGTAGMSLAQAVEEIRGRAGTKVTLTILRDNSDKPVSVDVTREKINVPSVILTFEGDNKKIAHIKLLKFAEDTNGEWDKAVTEINSKCGNDCKIVLDLRNNPGGYLQGSVAIASDFLPSGTTVVIEERGNGARQEYKTTRSPRLANYPLVVMINQGSASASEILAGALRDERKVKLVGEVSFGKGTIQEPDELSDGSGLHITIAKWLTPAGTWVHGKGLEPDVKIEPKEDETEDTQFLKAVEVVNSL